MTPDSPDYRNAILTGRGLTVGEITEDDFLNSPVASGPVGGPYRRLYDFPGETIESLKALWAAADPEVKAKVDEAMASMLALDQKMWAARAANPGREIVGIGDEVFIGGPEQP